MRVADREEVIGHYLAHERRRSRPFRGSTAGLRFDDANAMDDWLRRHRLKAGVMPGFRRWAWVKLGWEDLLDCTVHDRLSRGQAVRSLGDLLRIGFLDGWAPVRANPLWEPVIRAGTGLPPSLALVLRPALPTESARFYVEDGTGRAAFLAANRPSADVVAYAYLGFDPDPDSDWLRNNLDGGHFIKFADRYRAWEDVVGAASPLQANANAS